MTENEFVDATIAVARSHGYKIENSRNGLQIDFGHKKLHEKHLRALYPDVLYEKARISDLIERVAPGRPCSHKPMKMILSRLANRL
jgi:hypothetical protein